MTFELHASYFDLGTLVNSTFKTLEFLSKKKDITMDLKVKEQDRQYF